MVSTAEMWKINGKSLQEFIDEARERWHVPGLAVGLSVNDERQFYGSGRARIEDGKAFDENTVAPIGSVTKSFVAHAIGHAVSKGQLDWEEPLTEYVPDLGLEDPVTLVDLLSMRTGLDGDREWLAARDRSHHGIKTVAASLPRKAPFREAHLYSGFNLVLATMVLETVTGSSWTNTLIESLDGLGLEPLALSYAQGFIAGQAALGYVWNGQGYEIKTWPEGEIDLIDSGGSLCLSVRQLLTFLDTAMASPCRDMIFRPWILTRYPDVPLDFWPESYCLCWGRRRYRGHELIYHRGSDWGFRSLVAMVPDASLKIAITSNRHRNLLIHFLLNQILDAALGHSYIPWEPLFETYARQTDQE